MSVKVPIRWGNGLVFGAGGALACSGEPRTSDGRFQGGVGARWLGRDKPRIVGPIGACLCVPKIRFCNTGGEGRPEAGVT